MKTVKLLLKISGFIVIAVGVACLIVGYMDQLKQLLPQRKSQEFADYADVDFE